LNQFFISITLLFYQNIGLKTKGIDIYSIKSSLFLPLCQFYGFNSQKINSFQFKKLFIAANI